MTGNGWLILLADWARCHRRTALATGAALGGVGLLGLGVLLGVGLDLMLSEPPPRPVAHSAPTEPPPPRLSHRSTTAWPIYEDFSQAPEGPTGDRVPPSILDAPPTGDTTTPEGIVPPLARPPQPSAEPPSVARLLPPTPLPAPPEAADPDGAPTPPWRLNAVPVVADPGRDMVAVVIDDMGLDRRRTDRVIALPGPLTTSFLSYAEDLPAQTAAARRAGHELMIHLPMQPTNPAIDPGPGALTVDMDPLAISDALTRALASFPGFVGLNNHMGSRFTAQADPMRVVLSEVRRRGLLWLDSRTTADSVAGEQARHLGLPLAVRDVFLDHRAGRDVVRRQLAHLARIAHAHGYAVAIGHPRDDTIAELAPWIDSLPGKGLQLVPISAIVARYGLPANAPELAATPPNPEPTRP
ncbi:divergent polysaccharide deacetylase family protein [Roseospirillum parvum]|uniref:Divergent polysaccharide deacetylase n=1 Tax=Roseospirillum parvum TaxID=83401 RepID=A0A1G7U9L0_9PROT|nr:divergent polysaccharide deacetylase family protein [Roseospirillum parvum]SDG44114.1 hypothetical protein SAMN05421742_101256 [Roseospirillum parvum]